MCKNPLPPSHLHPHASQGCDVASLHTALEFKIHELSHFRKNQPASASLPPLLLPSLSERSLPPPPDRGGDILPPPPARGGDAAAFRPAMPSRSAWLGSSSMDKGRVFARARPKGVET